MSEYAAISIAYRLEQQLAALGFDSETIRKVRVCLPAPVFDALAYDVAQCVYIATEVRRSGIGTLEVYGITFEREA